VGKLPTTEPDRLLDVREAAADLGVKPSTVYAWVAKRKIPAVKLSRNLVRFRREDLDRLIRKSVQPALQRERIVPADD